MVQQIITLCDVCYDDGTTTEGHAHRVAVDGVDYSLELCQQHADALWRPLTEAAERLGAQVADKPAKRRPKSTPGVAPVRERPTLGEPCLICGQVQDSSAAMSSHYSNNHNLAGMTAVYGLACAVCGHEAKTSSGLGAHVGFAHGSLGLRSVPAGFNWAAANGDPSGVVAKRLAHLGLERPAAAVAA